MPVQVLARWILWRLIALLAAGLAFCVIVWGLDGGLARTLSAANASAPWAWAPQDGQAASRAVALGLAPLFSLATVCALLVGASRGLARRRRRYVRLRVVPYRTDESTAEGIVALFESLHKRLLVRGRRRVLCGQPSLALEVHRRASAGAEVWLAVSAPAGAEAEIEAALRVAYPNCALEERGVSLGVPPVLLRLRKKASFMLLLGTQSLADFMRGRADGVIQQLLDNCSTLLVHRLPGHDSASRASLELGSRGVERVSEHVEAGVGGWRPRGTAIRSLAVEPHVTPEELMALETGVAMLKTLGEPPRRVRVSSPRA